MRRIELCINSTKIKISEGSHRIFSFNIQLLSSIHMNDRVIDSATYTFNLNESLVYNAA